MAEIQERVGQVLSVMWHTRLAFGQRFVLLHCVAKLPLGLG